MSHSVPSLRGYFQCATATWNRSGKSYIIMLGVLFLSFFSTCSHFNYTFTKQKGVDVVQLLILQSFAINMTW